MKRLIALIIAGISCLAYAGGGRGTSDGGGANTLDGILIDFRDYKKETGGFQEEINPREFRMRDSEPVIYDQIRPMLNRLYYYYPGSKPNIDAVWEKTWVVVNQEFEPRTSEEKKYVVQRDQVIKISLPWLQGNPPFDMLKEVWLHEAIRQWSNALLKKISVQVDRSLHDKVLAQSVEDEFTQKLTPPLYENMSLQLIDQALRDLLMKLQYDLGLGDIAQNLPLNLASRAQIYRHFTNVIYPWKLEQKVCGAVKSSRDIRGQQAALYAALDEIAEHRETYFMNGYKPPKDALNNQLNNLSPDMRDVVEMIDRIGYWVTRPMQNTNTIPLSNWDSVEPLRELCWNITDESIKIYESYEMDRGQVVDPRPRFNVLAVPADHLPR